MRNWLNIAREWLEAYATAIFFVAAISAIAVVIGGLYALYSVYFWAHYALQLW